MYVRARVTRVENKNMGTYLILFIKTGHFLDLVIAVAALHWDLNKVDSISTGVRCSHCFNFIFS